MMFLRTVELAFARFQKTRDARALAIVFDRTSKELLRVARHVATDPAAAEDLVQATYLTAIEDAGSHQRGRPVLPWLLGILANHARAARRAERRAPDLQRLRGDVVADVHAEVEARDVRAQLTAAIARLPDAYRPALRLWFEHGLDAHEIAAVLERPAGTVRAQLSRGMESLRRLLPASLAGGAAMTALATNGLAAVRTNVLTHGAATPGLPSSLAIGGLLVLHHKLLGGAAALALAFLIWFVASPDATPDVIGANPTATTVVAAASAPTSTAAAPERVEGSTATATAPAPEPTASPRTTLVVHVRGSDGERLPGIGVALERPGRREFAYAFVRTDQDGTVRFEDEAPGNVSIQIDRVGRAGNVRVRAGRVTEHTVDVPVGIVVAGTVVDENGQPAGGATIVRHGSPYAAPAIATADAHGRFRTAHLPDGVELQAKRAGNAPSLAHQVEGTPGTNIELTLRLGAGGRRISGLALDAGGKPAPGTAIALLPAAATAIAPFARGEPQPRACWLTADRDGRFACDEVAPAKYVAVAVFVDWLTSAAIAEVDAGEHDAHVELRGGPPAVIEGSVRRDGTGLARVDVMGFTERCATPIGYLQNHLGHVSVATSRDGSFRIPNLLPGEFVLRAFAGTAVLTERRVHAVAGETVRCDIEVGRTNPLAIRVTAASPLPDGLHASVHHRATPEAAPSSVTIDARGNARIDAPRPGPVDVHLWLFLGGASCLGLARIENVAVDRGEVLFELSADQLPAHHLRGRLVDAVAAPVSGVTVRARRTDGPQVIVSMVEAMSAADGTFTIGPLPAGQYELTSGPLNAPRRLRDAAMTIARDEDLGDLALRK